VNTKPTGTICIIRGYGIRYNGKHCAGAGSEAHETFRDHSNL
jgi:hypothetical protein